MEYNKLFEDFKALQAAIQPITFNQQVSFKQVKFSYADLPSIHKVVKPLLHAHNFILNYIVDPTSVTCRITHKSGSKLESSIKFDPVSDPKQTGSLITYYKRYNISALLGIDTESDADVKPFEKPVQKAKMSKRSFELAQERIINHEVDVLKKCLLHFDLTDEEHKTLLNLDLEHNG